MNETVKHLLIALVVIVVGLAILAGIGYAVLALFTAALS